MSATLEKHLRPRKTPRQNRAVESRARILDAAREVFAAHGYAAGTTNRIAAAAHMSVGSIYQYFPNKDSILVELVRAHIVEGTAELLAAVGSPDDFEDVESTVRAAVSALVAVHVRDRRLHRVLFEESPRPASLLAELAELEDAAVAMVAQRLLSWWPDLAEPELRARLVATTIESLVHRFVATDRPLDEDLFVAETTRLIVGYLADVGPDRGERP
jgi:AcrR family transcriptional regulator